MVRGRLVLFTTLLALLVMPACHPYTVSSGRPAFTWTDISDRTGGLPDAVSVFEGVDEKTPLRAWYARIDLGSPAVRARVIVSNDADGREPVTDMAAETGACVAVNAGYFVSDDDRARHIGLLLSGKVMHRSATTGIIVEDIRYPTARAAIGFPADGHAEMAWVTTASDTILAWPSPHPNRPGSPGRALDRNLAFPWDVEDAVAAGPSLIFDGRTDVTINEEIFFDSPIPNVHPRTAAGIDRDGQLLLVVVDGRQFASRGVDLADLAKILEDLGAEYALNLDGGGSSSFVVNGQLLNRPVGDDREREVVSALSIVCVDAG